MKDFLRSSNLSAYDRQQGTVNAQLKGDERDAGGIDEREPVKQQMGGKAALAKLLMALRRK